MKYAGYNSAAGAFVPAVSETVKAQAVSGTGIDGVWSLQIHDVTNSFADVLVADKNRVESITFRPLVTNIYSLGESSRKWSVVHATDLGASGSRISKLWVTDIDCSGTCPGSGGYFSKDANGLYPTLNEGIDASRATGQFVKTKKLEIADQTATGAGVAFWDIQANANGFASSSLFIRDNAGNTILDLQRVVASSTVNRGILALDWLPDADSTRDLGSSSARWGEGHIFDVRTNQLHSGAGGGIEVYTSLFPDTTNTNALGSSTKKWSILHATDVGASASRLSKLWATDIDYSGTFAMNGTTVLDGSRNATVANLTIGGTCTGCPGGAVTDGGATTYVSATGDNFAVGTSSTSHKFEVSGGTSQFGGTIQPSFAGAYNIGSSSLYWNEVWGSSFYGVGSIQIMTSGIVRAQMTGGTTSSVKVIDGSNVTQAEMRSNGSFYAQGSQGISASFNPNSCSSITVTGGIITAKSGC